MIENTVEEIAQHHSACLDSVNLINTINAQDVKSEEDLDTISRNQEHLVIMLAKDFWTTEDMTAIEAASKL